MSGFCQGFRQVRDAALAVFERGRRGRDLGDLGLSFGDALLKGRNEALDRLTPAEFAAQSVDQRRRRFAFRDGERVGANRAAAG